MNRLLIVLLTAATLSGFPCFGDEAIHVERVIGPEFPGRYKHPASIEEFDNGDLFIAYYGGEGEYAEDTAVYGMRKQPGDAWSKPTIIADTPHRSEGNAVVWQAPDGIVWLFYVCRYGDTWSKSRIKAKLSKDRGVTWSDSFLVAFEQGMMVRNQPIVLANGDYLLPVYLEKGDDREAVGAESMSRFLRWDRQTKQWVPSGFIASAKGNIQPAVAATGDGRLVAYCRRGGGYGPTKDGYLVRAESTDSGQTWSRGVDSEFPNPNAAVDFLKLSSGHLLLIYNRSMSDRTPLSAAISTDNDKSYPHRLDLVTGEGPFAYPFAVQGQDETIHLVFTTEDRTVIKHATFRESAIVKPERQTVNEELVFKPLESPEEVQALQRIATQTFNFTDESWDVFLPMVGRENLRIAHLQGQIVGGMANYPVKQWFAGKKIPTAGIALVSVAPEHRGKGVAFEMLKRAMLEQRQNRVPLATLYPSTQTFYRKLGFEQAGNAYVYAFPTRAIGPLKQRLPMRQVEAAEHQQFHRLATIQAERGNGWLDRNEGMWKRVVRERAGRVFAYLIGERGNETGYLIYDQRRDAGWHSGSSQQNEQRSIVIHDMVALNAETLETIWAFLAGNRTVTELVKWTGPAIDPRNLVTAEYEPTVIRPNRWMLRLVDVQAALLQRGYAKLDADISFDVSDDIIQSNEAGFTLRIRQGQAEIDPVSSSTAIRITAKNLAPLYSGLLDAQQLQQLGMLSCQDEETIKLASLSFSTSEPWMPDTF